MPRIISSHWFRAIGQRSVGDVYWLFNYADLASLTEAKWLFFEFHHEKVSFDPYDFAFEILGLRELEACIVTDETVQVGFGDRYPCLVFSVVKCDNYAYQSSRPGWVGNCCES
jgi:hypothetical protein